MLALNPLRGSIQSPGNLSHTSIEQDKVFELPCHLATTIEGLTNTTMLEQRVQEFEFLTSEAFRAAIENQYFELVNFQQR